MVEPCHCLEAFDLFAIKGILTTKTDLILEKDLKAIEESIKVLQKYVELITNPKKSNYPRLKVVKVKI
ncbi:MULTISPECIES: hypothetical protein [unclassified Peribacillus]|uniref:hypothetical protein n=1 Tax=unclassified Peribacillus TaxID=2675266 RepID=UPI001A911447|nr:MULTISPECIES: hypothetical protein [unclassified Peribacillus]WMX57705.1 hypothetical protein RE409_11100 [Peribacillus sp. R9-11]